MAHRLARPPRHAAHPLLQPARAAARGAAAAPGRHRARRPVHARAGDRAERGAAPPPEPGTGRCARHLRQPALRLPGAMAVAADRARRRRCRRRIALCRDTPQLARACRLRRCRFRVAPCAAGRLPERRRRADALRAGQPGGRAAGAVRHLPARLAAAWRDGRLALDAAGASADEAWQAALWRRIDGELGMHALHPAEAFIQALQQGGSALARRAGLAQTVHVFALPDHAAAAPAAGAPAVALGRCAPVRAEPLPGILVRPGRPPPPQPPGRARPRAGAGGRQPPARRLGQADPGAHRGPGRPGRRWRRGRRRLRAGARAQPAGPAAERPARAAPDRARLGGAGPAGPQHRVACMPFAGSRARGAAGPPARPVRRRPSVCAPATSWW